MRERRDRRDRLIAIGLTLVALAPVITVLITRAGRSYFPVGDLALVDLRVRDVWSRDIPLTGAYSRFGWNHPGPLSFWLLAPFSALTGRAAWGTQVAGALLQGAAIVAIAMLAYRKRGLRFLAGVLALVGLSYGAAGARMLLEPWNPRVAFPFAILFLLLAWFIAAGDAWLLVPTAFVASFLVQSHVGYLPLVLAVVGLSAVFLLRRSTTGLARPLVATGAVLVVCWLPVLLQEVIHEHNLSRVADYFGDGGDADPVGGRAAAGIYGEEFAPLPPWFGGEHDVSVFSDAVVPDAAAWVLIPIGALVAAGVLARRWRDRDGGTLVALVAIASAAGVVSIARITAEPAGYLFYWRVPLALFTLLALGFIVVRKLPVRARTVVFSGALAVVVIASAATSTAIAQIDANDGPGERVGKEILEQLPRPEQPVLIRNEGTALFGLEATVINELVRDGAPVRVPPENAFRFGYSRDDGANALDTTWHVIENGYLVGEFLEQPGATLVASTSPLSADEERELQALQRDAHHQMVTAGRERDAPALDDPLVELVVGDVPGIDAQQLERIAELNMRVRASKDCRCAVIQITR